MSNKKILNRFAEILPLILFVVLAFTAICFASNKEIIIRFDGNEKIVSTMNADARVTVTDAGIVLGEADEVKVLTGKEILQNKVVIEVVRAVPIHVIRGGKSETFYTSKKTVKEALDGLKIKYDNRAVYPALDSEIINGEKIHLIGRFDEFKEETLNIEPPIEFIDDHNKVYGENEIVKEGAPGIAKVYSKVSLKDGFMQTEIIGREVVKEPETQIVRRGLARSIETSRGRMRYNKVLKMEITAYTLAEGNGDGVTSIGIVPYEGIVAVDPKVIPYYTKLYIPGYGIAMAGDTGGAIRGNRLDVFMHDLGNAISWGRRTLDVYILE